MSNNTPEEINAQEEEKPELSIFDIWNIAKFYLRDLLLFSWLIVGVAIALGYYLYNRKASQPATYTATLTFMLSEDKGFQQGMLGSLFGTVMTNTDVGNISLAKLDELIFTRGIMQRVLFFKASLPSGEAQTRREDYLINHYIDIFGYRKQWQDAGSPMATFSYKQDSFALFTREENSLMLTIYSQLINGQLSKYSSPGGIMTLSFTSTSEAYSYEFLTALFYIFNDYYTEKTTEKQKKLLEAARDRVSQLRGKMSQAEQAYIDYLNKNGASASGQNHVKVQTQYLARELQVEMEAYFGAVRAREAAEAALAQQIPLIQMIDAPIYPLAVNRPNASFHFLIGLFGGAFLVSAVIILRRIIWDYLKKAREKSAISNI
jgi:hypothetical protein